MTLHKLKKKKDRERWLKKMKHERQLVRNAEEQYNKQIDADVDANKPDLRPIVNPETAKKILLEKNLQLLKKIENEFIDETQKREDWHKELEAEGYSSLKDKFAAIKKKAEQAANTNPVVKQATENIDINLQNT